MTEQTNTLPSAEEVLLDKLLINDQATAKKLIICSIFEDERPIKGQAGMLDWKLCGFLSRFLIRGKISGGLNEFVYVPIRSGNSGLKHLLLVGLGSKKTQEEITPTHALLKNLVKTVQNLKFDEVAISRSSFPFWTEQKIRSAFSDTNVEFTQ